MPSRRSTSRASAPGVIYQPELRAVLLRVVRHLVQSVARDAHGDQQHAGAAAGVEPLLRSSAASGICSTTSSTSPRRCSRSRRPTRARRSRRPNTRLPATSACAAARSAWPATSPKTWQVFAGYTRLNALIVKAQRRHAGQRSRQHAAEQRLAVEQLSHLVEEWEVGGGATYLSQRYAANTNTVSVRRLHALGRDGRLASTEVRRAPEPAQRRRQASISMH